MAIKSISLTDFAQAAFEAAERVRMLEMMNTPDDYDKRNKAFIELAHARADAVRKKKDLDDYINLGGDPS